MSGNESDTSPFTIEFLGLPGVGKSSIAVRLGERLVREGLRVEQPSYELAHGIGRAARVARKLGIVGGELLWHPLASWRAWNAARGASRQLESRSTHKLRFNWLLVNAMARRAAERPAVSLFDEGLFQGLWSFGLEGDRAEVLGLLERLSALACLPRLVVVSHARRATVAERVRARSDNDSRLDQRLDEEPELLSRGAELLAELSTAIERHLAPRTELVHVTNETDVDLERAVDALAARIAAQIRSQTAATTRGLG